VLRIAFLILSAVIVAAGFAYLRRSFAARHKAATPPPEGELGPNRSYLRSSSWWLGLAFDVLAAAVIMAALLGGCVALMRMVTPRW
jgi:hypothetical protein